MVKKGILSFIFLLCISSNLSAFAQTERIKEFRFAVIGCAHIGICDTKDYESAIDKINAQNPDFVILLGGMIDPLSNKPIDSLQQKFNAITAKLKAPVYNVAGNCTLEERPILQEEISLMKENFILKNNKTYYSFEHNNNLFIILDSGGLLVTKTNGDQLDFLRKILQDTSKYNNIFVFLHKSLWSDIEGSDKWLKILTPIISNKVKYVFGAGTHYLDLRKNTGISYASTSASCLQDPSNKMSFPHFLIVEVAQKDVRVKVTPLEGIPIEKLTGYEKHYKTIDYNQKPVLILSQTLESPERITLLQPDRIIEALNIKPGMNILDIGAGSGLFSFRFANALKGTGHVFAAETNPHLVDYINETAAQSNLNNISGILVQSKGVDNLIKQETFDIIFLSEVYHYLGFPKDYFQELKSTLKKDTGRLYIIHFKNISEFSKVEFGDFKGVMQILSSETKDFPISLLLSKTVREFISGWQDGKEVPAIIQDQIIAGLNNMLSDRWLFSSLSAYYAIKGNSGNSLALSTIINTANRKLFEWLLAELDNNEVFKKNKKTISEADMVKLKVMNRLLLTDFFKSNVLFNLTSQQPYLWKNSLITTLEEAGLKYLGESNILTHHHFLEFKRKE